MVNCAAPPVRAWIAALGFLFLAFISALALTAGTAATASADSGTVWFATLSVKDVNTVTFGCSDYVEGALCEDGLSDNTFAYGGVDYTITELRVNAGYIGPLILRLDKNVSDSLKGLTLLVCDQQLPLADATINGEYILWFNTQLGWAVGQTVSVSLGGVCGGQPAAATLDDDAAGVTVSAETLTVTEHGDLPSEQSTATYTIVLDAQPSSWVRIQAVSSDTSRITIYPRVLDFTPQNWDVPRTVKVNALFDYDAADDTIILTHIVTASYAPKYEDMTAASVTVTMKDVDEAAVVVGENTLNINVGQSTSYYVRLDAAPTGSNEVVVTATSNAETTATVAPTSRTFTADNWDGWQRFTVTGVSVGDATIRHSISGTESTYAGNIILESVAVTVTAPPGQSDPPQEQRAREPAQDGKAQKAQEQRAEPESAGTAVPGPVGNVLLTAEADSVTVAWDAPSTGGALNRYIVWLKPEDGSKGKTKRLKASKLSTTFRNLEAGKTYNISVRAQNEAGKGERTWVSLTLPANTQE